MQNIKKYFQYSLLAVITMLYVGLATPQNVFASEKCEGAGSHMFTFPAWYKGLPGTCSEPKIEALNDIWIIVLNFIEILLQIVAYVAAGFVVWGGFKYIKSEGEPAKITESRAAIMNAVIGLVIALASVALVTYVQGSIIQPASAVYSLGERL